MSATKMLKAYSKLRRTWDVKPVTRVMPDKKKYKRKGKYGERYEKSL